MNWEAIGAIGEIIGAIAVFVSLIYLAMQVRGSLKQSRAMMASNITMEQSNVMASISNDRGLAEIFQKLEAGEEARPVENIQLRFLLVRVTHVYAGIQSAFENGQLDEGFYTDCQQQIGNLTQIPLIRRKLKASVIANHPSIEQQSIFSSVFDD